MTSILLIEDDKLLREVLATALTQHGYAVAQAEDGEQGVKLFRAGPTDLVITDIVMPNKDGVATIADLRRDYPKLGIIAISGNVPHGRGLYLKIAGGLGATRTLAKPFAHATLLTAINEVLAETGRVEPLPVDRNTST
mgnify:CR=1 FL=1